MMDLLGDRTGAGQALGADGERVVGWASSLGATMWFGGADDYVRLHPVGSGTYGSSRARGVAGEQQVGNAGLRASGLPHAVLWRGSAESMVDLHPPGAEWSEAFATDGVRQGGWLDVSAPGVGLHAALWEGSAASFIDMNPDGALESRINAMAPGVQLGFAQWQGHTRRAALWRSSAASYEDYTPPGAGGAEIHATSGEFHAGHAFFASLSSATVWLGSSDHVIDLHALLGPEYASSVATGVHVEGDQLWVSGYALASPGGYRAFAWTGPVPGPSGAAVLALGLALGAWRRRRH